MAFAKHTSVLQISEQDYHLEVAMPMTGQRTWHWWQHIILGLGRDQIMSDDLIWPRQSHPKSFLLQNFLFGWTFVLIYSHLISWIHVKCIFNYGARRTNTCVKCAWLSFQIRFPLTKESQVTRFCKTFKNEAAGAVSCISFFSGCAGSPSCEYSLTVSSLGRCWAWAGCCSLWATQNGQCTSASLSCGWLSRPTFCWLSLTISLLVTPC